MTYDEALTTVLQAARAEADDLREEDGAAARGLLSAIEMVELLAGVTVTVEIDEDEGVSTVNGPPGVIVQERYFPGYDSFRENYRHLTDEEKRAEGLETADGGITWFFSRKHRVK